MARYRTTIILVGVLVVLGLAVFLIQSPNSTGTATATPTPTTNLWGHKNSDDITAIDVLSGTQHVGLRKEVTGTDWLLVAPIQAQADSYTVSSIADQLKTLNATDTITNPGKLSDFGLDSPVMTVTLAFTSTTTDKPSLLIGKQTPDVTSYYAKLASKNDVYIISNATIEPIKGWLDSPPKAQPTTTPLQVTVLPPPSPTATSAAGTETPAGAASPPVIIAPSTITGTSTITSTSPGAANSTTPIPPTLPPSPTK